MAKQSKHGNKKNKPSHVHYVAVDRRAQNKRRRIMRCNGEAFLKLWEKLPKGNRKHHKTKK